MVSWGWGKWGVSVQWDRISSWEDEKILEMDKGEGCPAMFLMPLNYTLKNASRAHLGFCILTTREKHNKSTMHLF